MASLKKKELRKKRLARKKARGARLKDIKAIGADLAKSVEAFYKNTQPLESLGKKGINEKKGHCQNCHIKGYGGGLQKYRSSEPLFGPRYAHQFLSTVFPEHQHADKKTFRELLQQLPPLVIPGPKKIFTLFPSLPKELRNKIWGYVADQTPRIAIVRRRDYLHPDDRFRWAAMMSICRESRAEGERHYTWKVENTVLRTLRHYELLNRYYGVARGVRGLSTARL